jgi:hypothetical protein
LRIAKAACISRQVIKGNHKKRRLWKLHKRKKQAFRDTLNYFVEVKFMIMNMGFFFLSHPGASLIF